MRDPLDALREPIVPVDPDPRFGESLRARLVDVVLAQATTGTTSEETEMHEPSPSTQAERVGVGALTAYLSVSDARRALDFYVAAFGARPRGEPYVMPDGSIGHAEMELGSSVLMFADPAPEYGMNTPLALGATSVLLHLAVDDVDAAVERAVAAGATLSRPAGDNPYGRNAVVTDFSGHRWMLSGPNVEATSGP